MNTSVRTAQCAPVEAERPSEQDTPSGEAPPQMVFPSTAFGLGIHRSTGNLIALLLHLEDPDARASILARAVRDMGIPINDVVREFNDDP